VKRPQPVEGIARSLINAASEAAKIADWQRCAHWLQLAADAVKKLEGRR
jgi:hypothetical protein